MLGEGPVWDEASGNLVWVDITRQLVQFYDPQTSARKSVNVGATVGIALPRSAGGFVLLRADGIATLSVDGRIDEVTRLPFMGETQVRTNDGNCDSAGRLWAGTMGLQFEPGVGRLYRVNSDWSISCVLDGVTISNGIGWSPDDCLMYYVDSATRMVDVFDFDAGTGEIENRRVFVSMDRDSPTLPDGLAVDEQGFVWVAMWGASAVHRYDPEGNLERMIRLPTRNVTNCAFGGRDLGELYMTSACEGLEPDPQGLDKHAGALFRCRPGVRGMKQMLFAG